MKFLSMLRALKSKKVKPRTKEEYQQDLLNKQGREQFSKLVAKGLQLPIAVL